MTRGFWLVSIAIGLLGACGDGDETGHEPVHKADTSEPVPTLTPDEVDQRIAAAVAPLSTKLDELSVLTKLANL
jgi:hypothetical protein